VTFFQTCTSCSRSFITTLFHSSVHFFPVLVKGLYQTESYSLHVMQLMYKFERMSRYILNEAETSHHLILIRLYFILTILITKDDHNHIFFNNCNSAGFFFILVKGLYQTESYSLHVMQLIRI
jgi:hypothetical protein